MRSAKQIWEEVAAHLAADERVDTSDMRVEVDGGSVRLFGSVETFAAKLAATGHAWSVGDVTDVDNRIRVRPTRGRARPDSEVGVAVEAAIDAQPDLDLSDIDVAVVRGAVTLEGAVDEYWKKDTALAAVADVSGVVEIHDKLVVVPLRDHSDEDIAHQVIDAIAACPGVSENDVQVMVQGGIVVLTGAAHDRAARRRVHEAACRIVGVRAVRNDITVPRPLTS